MARLRQWGYEFVSFGDMAEDPRPGRVALTFDDGFADNASLVGLLGGAPATVFVASRCLGQRHADHPAARFLEKDELRELAAHVEIGSHSAHHVDLTALSPGELERELVDSRADLQDVTGQPVDVLAYPFGRVNAAVEAAAAAAGYRAACGTSGRGGWDQPMHLPRQDMTNGASMLGLRLKRDDQYERLAHTLPGRMALAARRALAVRG